MLEIEIKYNIFLNKKKLLRKIIKNINNYSLLLENGEIIKRKDIVSVNVICDVCECDTILKNIPEQYLLEKDTYLCISCRNKGENNPVFGRKWSDEMKLDRSAKYSGESNPMFGKNVYSAIIDKYGYAEGTKRINKQKELLSIKSKGENNPMFGKTYYDVWVEKYGKEIADKKQLDKSDKQRKYLLNNPEQLNRMIINSHKIGYRKTSIERKVDYYLIENNITYKYNFIINKYQFDFILPDKNIIIETHGDYWHANPNIYSNTDDDKKPLNERQLYKVDKDIEKSSYINNNTDYKIIYLWETDIKNNEFKKILKEWNL